MFRSYGLALCVFHNVTFVRIVYVNMFTFEGICLRGKGSLENNELKIGSNILRTCLRHPNKTIENIPPPRLPI